MSSSVRAVACDVVLDAARYSDSALAHRLIDELHHALDFRGGCSPPEILLHHLLADAGMTDDDGQIQGGRIATARIEPRTDRVRRITVETEHDAGDSLSDLRLRERLLLQRLVRVVVHVDEAGRQHQAARIDDRVVRLRLECADPLDAIADDADIRGAQRGAGTVRDLRVDDDRATSRRLLLRCRAGADHQTRRHKCAASACQAQSNSHVSCSPIVRG